MASKVICDKSDLVAIANAVREKSGSNESYYVSDLAGAVGSISTTADPILQNKTVSPTTYAQTIVPDSGYDGLAQVTIDGVPVATTSNDGLMSAVDKSKLDGIDTGANKTTIDSSLTQADQAADAKAVGDALATKQPVGDYVLKGEIPESSSAIIDVVELPTENINEGAFYRLLTAKFVSNYYYHVGDWVCHYVNELPSVGEPVSTDMVNITAYYNVQDGEVYGYADSMISAAGGIPVGWYSIGILGQAFDIAWGGVITDPDDVDDTAKVLLSKDFYVYQDGWCNVPFACEKAPEIDIRWDGVIGDRFALDLSLLGYADTYLVKVSDEVLTVEQIIGFKFIQANGANLEITESDIDTSTYPGAISINGGSVVIVHSADELNAALGLPTEYVTNGIYFVYIIDENYTNRLVSPSKVVKIDGKYLPDLTDDLAPVATSGDYYDLSNRPEVYTKREVDNKIANIDVDVDLSDYYNKTEVDNKIANIETDNVKFHTIDVKNSNATQGAICYGSDKFILDGTTTLYYSSDGYVWKPSNIAWVNTYGGCVCYGGGMYVAARNNLERGIVYSEDGIIWEYATIKDPSTLYPTFRACALVYTGEKFILVSQDKVYYSIDGRTWECISADNNFSSVNTPSYLAYAYHDGILLVSETTGGTHPMYKSTDDGKTWVSCGHPGESNTFTKICYGNGRFVASSGGVAWNASGRLMYSETGSGWSDAVLPTPVKCVQSVCYGNGKFVAISKEGIVFHSLDGVTWSRTDFIINNTVYDICYGNGKFVAIGEYAVFCSEDGIKWTSYDKYLTCGDQEISSDVANLLKQFISPSDIGALPADTIIPSIEGLATEDYVNTQIASIPTPDVSGQITTHNTATDAHNDIRLLIEGLTTRLNTLADSDDTTLDQMSEIVAYIKSNKSLIEGVTTNKVNVSDIIDNLTTNIANKPLSAAQGVALKALIDALDTNKLDASALTTAVNTALAQAKASGEFDGSNGKDGTSVTVNSVSESTADGGSNVVTFSDGKTLTIKNGTKGSKGDKGDSPVRGTDYWTAADKAEIKAYVDEAILGGAW